MTYFNYLGNIIFKKTHIWFVLGIDSFLLFTFYLLTLIKLIYWNQEKLISNEIIINDALYYINLFYYLTITIVLGYLIYEITRRAKNDQSKLCLEIENYSTASILITNIGCLIMIIFIFNFFLYFVILNVATLVSPSLFAILNQKLWNSFGFSCLYGCFLMGLMLFCSNFFNTKWLKKLIIILAFTTSAPIFSNIFLTNWNTIIKNDNLSIAYQNQKLRYFEFQILNQQNRWFDQIDNFYEQNVTNWNIKFQNGSSNDFTDYLTLLIQKQSNFKLLEQRLQTSAIVVSNIQYLTVSNTGDNLVKRSFYEISPEITLTENQAYVCSSNYLFLQNIYPKLQFEMRQFSNFSNLKLIRLKNDIYSQSNFLKLLGRYLQLKFVNLIKPWQISAIVSIFANSYLLNNNYARHLLMADFDQLYNCNVISDDAKQAKILLLQKKWLNRCFITNQFMQASLSNFSVTIRNQNQLLLSNLNLNHYKTINNQWTQRQELWLKKATVICEDVQSIYVLIAYSSLTIVLLLSCFCFII